VSVVLPTGRETAMHESHHAAALCLAGMVPKCVRSDWPTRDSVGVTCVDWGDGPDHEKAREVLRAILVGGMCNGFEGWDRWPIDPERVHVGSRRDAEQARLLAKYIGVDDHATWLFHVWRANQLARTPEFRWLAVAIADELERVEILDAEDLRSLMARAEEAVALCST
jgi:hypothetical protein